MARLHLVHRIGLVSSGEARRTRSAHRVRQIRRRKVLEFFQTLPRGRVLDAPSGSLWLAQALAARGFAVDAVDQVEPYPRSTDGGIHCWRGDLNDGLPQFPDGAFDYVVSVEGLEHLERPALLLREFSRVLRRHGLLLVTTPNICSLRSRLKFLLFGYFDGFRRRPLLRLLEQSASETTPHITPIHLQFLYYWLTEAGFVHIEAHGLPARRVERLALLPLGALVAGLGLIAARRAEAHRYADYLDLLVSGPLLWSPSVVLSAERAA